MIKTVIIEDEVAGQELIRHYLNKPGSPFEVVSVIDNVNDAVSYLLDNDSDLVLMDIQIKQGSGFDVLARLEKREFELVFITAYDQYAIQAIKQRAFDYVLKPLVEAEFMHMMKSVEEKINKSKLGNAQHIIIQRNNKIEKLDLKEIIFFEADGAYTYIQTLKEKIYTSKNLGEYEGMVSSSGFIRSHHSYLVNMDHVSSVEKKRSGILELTNGFRIPVSQRRIADFMKYFKGKK